MGSSTSKLILVGEAPGGVGKQKLPALDPSGATGRRIARLLELTDEGYRRLTDRRNLFHTPDEGVKWNARLAAERAIAILYTLLPGDRVIVLGLRAAQAFDIAHLPRYTWTEVDSSMPSFAKIAWVPHPSGRNRQLNDPEERERLADFLRKAL